MTSRFATRAFAAFLAPLATAGTSALCARPEEHPNLQMWSDRWKEDNTKWHKDQPHAKLVAYRDNFKKGSKILVPLCGKTVDLTYLAALGHDVVGVEGVMKAIREYGLENAEAGFDAGTDLNNGDGAFERYGGTHASAGTTIEMLRGDFLQLTKEDTKEVESVWDRAAFVAIRPEMRHEYVKAVGRTLKPGGVILLTTFWRVEGTPEAVAGGPPFSVSEEDVKATFGAVDWVDSIELVDNTDIFTDPAWKYQWKRWQDAGLTEFRELTFVIRKKK